MTNFYLITGFLGAGKTTFLKKFIPFFKGKKLSLIINEFGKEGVDGTLLKEIGATLNEISGGSIFCSCRLDKFEEALKGSLFNLPEVLIVEASGLSDPTNIRLILEEYEKNGKLKFKGAICLADAMSFEKVFATARVVKKQLNTADLILISKADLAGAEKTAAVKNLIESNFPSTAIFQTSFGTMEKQWLHELNPSNKLSDTANNKPDITTQRANIAINPQMTEYELKKFIAMFAEETSRIKGFVYLESSGWLLADCVGSLIHLTPWQGQPPTASLINVLAVGGMQLRKTLKYAAKWYENFVNVEFG